MFQTLSWAYNHPQEILIALLAATAALVLGLLLANRVPLSYNVYNLMVRWWNTLLISFAFTIVVGLVTGLLGFVNGMYLLTENSGQPGNVLILAEGSTDESFSNLGFADLSDIENQPGILRGEDGQPVTSRETYLIANQPIENPQPGRPKRRFLQVRGVDDPVRSARVHRMQLLPGGEWFSAAGVRDVAGRDGASLVEVVLGWGIAGELGQDRSPAERARARDRERLTVGDTFSVGDRTWLVVGVCASSGSTYDSEVWAKQSLIGPMFGKGNFTTLVARTAVDPPLVQDALAGKLANVSLNDAERALLTPRVAQTAAGQAVPLDGLPAFQVKALQDAAARRVRQYFADEYKKSAVSAQVETDYFKNLSATNIQFLVAIAVVTVIISLGGIFGVMNTMFAAISQRTKDIGVLRLLGYKRRSILVSFLLESLVLAILGGLVGCAAGYLADGLTANSVVSGGQGGGKFVVLRVTVDAGVLAVGFLLAVLMGFLGGLIPSLSAMRLSALDALR